jgi:hypothetical protein
MRACAPTTIKPAPLGMGLMTQLARTVTNVEAIANQFL